MTESVPAHSWAARLQHGLSCREVQALTQHTAMQAVHTHDALFHLRSLICRRESPVTVIAIDGFSGAGKTTLADHLHRSLVSDRPSATVHRIAMDHHVPGWNALSHGVEEVGAALSSLSALHQLPHTSSCDSENTQNSAHHVPARASVTLNLPVFNWECMRTSAPISFSICQGDVLIVEGCGSWLACASLPCETTLILSTACEKFEQHSELISHTAQHNVSVIRLWADMPEHHRDARIAHRDHYDWPRQSWDHQHQELLHRLTEHEQWPRLDISSP